MLRLKTWSAREASIHSAFMANGQLLLALSTQRMSYPSRKWGCGVSPRFHLALFVIGVNQEKWEAGRVQDYQHQWWKTLLRPSSNYKKLVDKVAFSIGYIAWRLGYKIVAHDATSVGAGRRNRLLFVCMYQKLYYYCCYYQY